MTKTELASWFEEGDDMEQVKAQAVELQEALAAVHAAHEAYKAALKTFERKTRESHDSLSDLATESDMLNADDLGSSGVARVVKNLDKVLAL